MDISYEQQLVERAKSDPYAFGELYDYYYPKISNYILHRLGNEQVAQDITSEVFIKAMKALPKFTWRHISFSSWLYKIATNEIATYFRKKSNRHLSLDFMFEKHNFEIKDATNIEEEYSGVEEIQKRHEDFLIVQKHLLLLPLKYQEVIALRYFEKKKLTEISEITGKNVNTTKTHLMRGINALRESIEKNGENSR